MCCRRSIFNATAEYQCRNALTDVLTVQSAGTANRHCCRECGQNHASARRRYEAWSNPRAPILQSVGPERSYARLTPRSNRRHPYFCPLGATRPMNPPSAFG